MISLGLSAQSSLVTAVLIHFFNSFWPSIAAACLMEVISELTLILLTIFSSEMTSAVSLPMTSAAFVRSKSLSFTRLSSSM